MTWFFFIHPAHRAAKLYVNYQYPGLAQAYEEHWPALEIRAGSLKSRLFISLTPNVDINDYRKRWCLDYCAFYRLNLREYDRKPRDSLQISPRANLYLSLQMPKQI